MPEKKPIDILYNEYLANTLSEEDLHDFLVRLNDAEGLKQVEMMMEGTWGEMFGQFENLKIREFENGALSTKGMDVTEEFDNSTIRQFDNGGVSTGGKEKFDNSTIRQFDNGDSSTGGINVPENEEVEVEVEVERTAKVISILKWTAAAAIIGFIVWGLWFVVGGNKDHDDSLRQAQTDIKQDIKAPETNRAMITLADGRTVYLDSAGVGELANVSGVEVMKMEDGKIVYRESSIVNGENMNRDASTGLSMTYNTLTNPRGSKVIDITLSDGSRVWLNAGSSLRYPVVFNNDKREVELIGEGYFSVTHLTPGPSPLREGGKALRSKIPFLVKSGGVVTEVLGTEFNVNAYEDEGEIRVTLLEGSVVVKPPAPKGEDDKPTKGVILRPRQQARLMSNELSVMSGVDTEAVMAWKNGLFSFDNADFATVMRQLARWYDLDVYYQGGVPKGKFKGEISKDLTLGQILNGLSITRINYRLEGKKITILPE